MLVSEEKKIRDENDNDLTASTIAAASVCMKMFRPLMTWKLNIDNLQRLERSWILQRLYKDVSSGEFVFCTVRYNWIDNNDFRDIELENISPRMWFQMEWTRNRKIHIYAPNNWIDSASMKLMTIHVELYIKQNMGRLNRKP